MSDTSIDPDVWGSYMWFTIHYVALGYPEKPSEIDKKNYKEFYKNLQYTIPCQKCKEHYIQMLTLDNNLILKDSIFDNKIKLFRWTVDIHNAVNKRLNKKILKYSEAICDLHNNNRNMNAISELFTLILFIFVFIIFYKIMKYKK